MPHRQGCSCTETYTFKNTETRSQLRCLECRYFLSWIDTPAKEKRKSKAVDKVSGV